MYQIILNKTPDGKSLQFDNPQIEFYLQHIKSNRVLVKIEEFREKASPAQRGHYFAGIVKQFSLYMGWSEEETHDWLKSECNKKQIVMKGTGEIKLIPSSTAGYNKKEMGEYIDRCVQRIAEEGFNILTPDEYFASITHSKENANG